MQSIRWQIAQWFELKWWQNYLGDKNKQEYLAWKKSYWLNVLQQVEDTISIKPSDTIADLGCGPAGVFIALPNNKITAVDPLLNEYDAKLSFFDVNDYSNTTFINAPLEAYNATAHDIVCCMNCINHVHDIEKAFDVVVQSMKPDGVLLLSIDAHNHTLFKHIFRAIPGDILHPHQYSLAEYESFLTKRGLHISQQVLLKREFFFNHYLLVAKYVPDKPDAFWVGRTDIRE